MLHLNKKIFLEILENLYYKYNRREFVSPDPLQFLYNYSTFCDIETVALISSSLAYGNVKMILKNIEKILSIMGCSPENYLKNNSLRSMKKDFSGFKHRFTTGDEVANLIFSIKKIYEKHGSMYNIFYKIYSENKHCKNISETVKIFFRNFFRNSPSLIPNPEKNSACKRIHLFLRWMTRKDNVDIGIWENIDSSYLIVPLDTHMLKISNLLNLTNRKTNCFSTALQITENFSRINPFDPVKYDFVLTRFGIRKMPLDFIHN